MKRRELLMLVASGGSVFAPSMASGSSVFAPSMASGSEHSFDDVVDPDAISPDEADSPMTTPDDSDPDETDPATETDRETVELTIELY